MRIRREANGHPVQYAWSKYECLVKMREDEVRDLHGDTVPANCTIILDNLIKEIPKAYTKPYTGRERWEWDEIMDGMVWAADLSAQAGHLQETFDHFEDSKERFATPLNAMDRTAQSAVAWNIITLYNSWEHLRDNLKTSRSVDHLMAILKEMGPVRNALAHEHGNTSSNFDYAELFLWLRKKLPILMRCCEHQMKSSADFLLLCLSQDATAWTDTSQEIMYRSLYKIALDTCRCKDCETARANAGPQQFSNSAGGPRPVNTDPAHNSCWWLSDNPPPNWYKNQNSWLRKNGTPYHSVFARLQASNAATHAPSGPAAASQSQGPAAQPTGLPIATPPDLPREPLDPSLFAPLDFDLDKLKKSNNSTDNT